jgi:hypothetical protein
VCSAPAGDAFDAVRRLLLARFALEIKPNFSDLTWQPLLIVGVFPLIIRWQRDFSVSQHQPLHLVLQSLW